MLSNLSSMPGSLGLPLMQSAGGLTEPGPFPPQVHSQIGQGQAFRFQNECPYIKPDSVPFFDTSSYTGFSYSS
jgi:hypothetical protein